MNSNEHLTLKNRQSNIELLRIFAALGIVILHINLMGAVNYSEMKINKIILIFLECVSIPAVNLFLILMGYFMYKKEKITLWKPIQLLFEVSIIKFIFYLFTCLFISKSEISFMGIISSIIPNNYFIIFYCAVYMFSIFINKLINSIDKESNKKLLIISFIIISLYPFIIDCLNSTLSKYDKSIADISTITRVGAFDVYTLIHFLFMYFIGGYIKVNSDNIFKKINNKKMLFSLVIIVLLIFISTMMLFSGKFEPGLTLAYNNPLIIIYAIILFLTFLNFKIEYSAIINKISKASLMCYLVNIQILRYVVDESIIKNLNFINLFIYIILIAIGCYIVSYLINLIYMKVESCIFNKLKKYLGELEIKINYEAETGKYEQN